MSITNYGQPVNIGNGITIAGTMASGIAGEDLSKLNICSLENGVYVKATNASANYMNAVCISNSLAGEVATFLVDGFIQDIIFEYPLGSTLYLSPNTGEISLTPSDRIVGVQIEEHLVKIDFRQVGSVASVSWDSVTGKPLAFPPETHLHPEIALLIPDELADLQEDITHRTVTDTEKTFWNNKQPAGDYEPANVNIQNHISSLHAPSNAQKNSDILKSEIEAKLTGEVSTHTHAGGGGDNQVIVRKVSDTPNATVNMADSGLEFNALANSDYIIEGSLLWNTSATTVGIKLSGSFSGASPNAIAGQWIVNVANGTLDGAAFNANDVTVTTTAAPFTTNNHAIFFALLRTGANAGTFKIRFAAEIAGTITIKTGSTLRYQKTL